MAIRLVRLDAASTGYADEAWEYMQACKAVAGDELAGLGCLEDCTSLEQVRRHWLPQVVNEAEGENLPPGYVPALQFLALEPDGTLVGMIQLRLDLNDRSARTGGVVGTPIKCWQTAWVWLGRKGWTGFWSPATNIMRAADRPSCQMVAGWKTPDIQQTGLEFSGTGLTYKVRVRPLM